MASGKDILCRLDVPCITVDKQSFPSAPSETTAVELGYGEAELTKGRPDVAPPKQLVEKISLVALRGANTTQVRVAA